MSTDIFRFKAFSVIQNSEVFKVGTDACLLGAWVDGSVSIRILDIGTGTGVIALMLAQRNLNAMLTAIDQNPNSAELSRLNFSNSPWNERLNAIHTSLMDFMSEEKFDLVVSNPPYFKDSLQNPSVTKSLARHETEMNLFDLMKRAYLLTRDEGELAVILPFDRKKEFQSTANDLGWFEFRFCDIKPFPSAAPNRFMSQLRKFKSETLGENLAVYESPKQYSEHTKKLLKDFYLIF